MPSLRAVEHQYPIVNPYVHPFCYFFCGLLPVVWDGLEGENTRVMNQFQDFLAVEDKNTNIIKKYVTAIYEHLFSWMHQILHLKLDYIIQGTK